MKIFVLGTLFLLLGGSYLSSRQFCACTSTQSGVSSVSWTGLNRISSLEYHDDYKDQVFRLCTLVCQPVNFDFLPTVNLTTGLPSKLTNSNISSLVSRKDENSDYFEENSRSEIS